MADNRSTNAGTDCGSNFKKMLSEMGLVKQTVDKSIRRTDDILRKYNNAKRSDDGEEQAKVLGLANKSGSAATANSASKKDVADAVSAASQNTAKRLDELFGKKATSSVATAQISKSGTKASDKTAESVTKMQSRLEELFGEQKTRGDATSNRLEELFGHVNTKLTGVDNSINEVKEKVKGRFSVGGILGFVGELLLSIIKTPPAMMALAFMGGFIKGWISVQPWFQPIKNAFAAIGKFATSTVWPWLRDTVWPFLKDDVMPFLGKVLDSKIGKALIGGGIAAWLVNKLTGGLLGAITKPLLGVLGKAIGGIIVKGIPAIIKGGIGAVKGLAGFMTTPIGAGVLALGAGVAVGAAINHMISKREEKFQKQMEKLNSVATKLSGGEGEHNVEEAKSLGDKILGGEKQISITGDDGNTHNLTGHYDESGGFVVTGTMGSDGKKKPIETQYTIPKANIDRLGAVEEDYSQMIQVASSGAARVNFLQVPESVKDGFEKHIDETYGNELDKSMSGHAIVCGLVLLAQHFIDISGEGITTKTVEHWYGDNHVTHGLPMEQIANSVCVIINNVGMFSRPSRKIKFDWQVSSVKRFFGVNQWSRYLAKRHEYDDACSEILSKMIPESAKGWFQGILDKTISIEDPNYVNQIVVTNWFVAGYAVYQFWSDIFVDWMNSTYNTDFKHDTVTEEEYEDSQKKGIVSQSMIGVKKGLQDIRIAKKLDTTSGRVDARKRLINLRKKQNENNGLLMTGEETAELKELEQNYKRYALDDLDEDIKTEKDSEQIKLLRELKEEVVKTRESADSANESSKQSSDDAKKAFDAGMASAVMSASANKKLSTTQKAWLKKIEAKKVKTGRYY